MWAKFTNTSNHSVLVNLDNCDCVRMPTDNEPRNARCVIVMNGGTTQSIIDSFQLVQELVMR